MTTATYRQIAEELRAAQEEIHELRLRLASLEHLELRHQQTEQRLRTLLHALERERALFMAGPVVVFHLEVGAKPMIRYVSPNVAQFGYTPETFTSGERRFTQLVYVEDALESKRISELNNTNPKVLFYDLTYRLIKANGDLVWVYDFTHVVRGFDGNPTHFYYYIFEITALKQAEQDAQTARTLAEVAYDATIRSWANALELRDIETLGHAQRVTAMSRAFGEFCELSQSDLEHLHRGALLHDVGKLAIPDEILHKPEKLSPAEWRIMRLHTVYACDWLGQIEFLKPALPVICSHHERWDGSGYPKGLRGEQIPRLARIFTLVDVWDALTFDRPYSPAWSHQQAREYFQQQRGAQFDPALVDLFLQFLEKKTPSRGPQTALFECVD